MNSTTIDVYLVGKSDWTKCEGKICLTNRISLAQIVKTDETQSRVILANVVVC